MIVQRVWFSDSDPTQESELVQQAATVAKTHIPYKPTYKENISSLEDDSVKHHIDLSVEDVGANFFGYLRAGEYEKAALLFEVDQYMDYFFRDYQELQQYIDRLNNFGNTITRNQQLVTVHLLRSEKILENQMNLVFECVYTDRLQDKIEIQLQFVSKKDGHDHAPTWFIADSVEEIVEQVQKQII